MFWELYKSAMVMSLINVIILNGAVVIVILKPLAAKTPLTIHWKSPYPTYKVSCNMLVK